MNIVVDALMPVFLIIALGIVLSGRCCAPTPNGMRSNGLPISFCFRRF